MSDSNDLLYKFAKIIMYNKWTGFNSLGEEIDDTSSKISLSVIYQ